MNEKFTFFWQSQSPFSQWHRSDFTIDGITFTCTEQMMMYEKAILMKDYKTAEAIMKAGYDPKKHKSLGRKVKPFDAGLWEASCKEIVYKANYLKFTQNHRLMEALLSTKGTTLVEASPYDSLWGIGLLESDPRAHDRSTWRGKNWLGETITQLRINLIGE